MIRNIAIALILVINGSSAHALAPVVAVESDTEKPYRDADLSVRVANDDLLEGAAFSSNLELQCGTLFTLTDGTGSVDSSQNRTFGFNGTTDWVVTFKNLHILELHELRVFSYNGDGRAIQDYDVSFSADRGQTFAPIAKGVMAEESRAYNLTRVPVENVGKVTDLRFTFRNPGDRRNPNASMHSSLMEIDAIGVAWVPPTLAELRELGAKKSAYHGAQLTSLIGGKAPEADLAKFRQEIWPILENNCVQCHGPEKQKAKFRIDTLNPDLVNGADASWWLEVMDVLSNGEMPPPEDVEMADTDRSKVINWLSNEVHIASQVKRSEGGHSSFRRMTRYEFNYALQDLLSLPYNFAKDLPPEAASEDGFQNSSEMLQISASQFSTYREIARTALQKATVRGDQPEPVYFGITMEAAAERAVRDLANQKTKFEKEHPDDPKNVAELLEEYRLKRLRASTNNTHFLNRDTGEASTHRSGYGSSLWKPSKTKPEDPSVSPHVLVLPHQKEQQIDLGDYLPDAGTVRIRFRASRVTTESESFPSLRLKYGYQPSNNSKTSFGIGQPDIAITAPPEKPEFYEWQVPLGEIRRNPYRGERPLGKRPNPSEYFVFQNVHQSSEHAKQAGIQIDYIEVIAPFHTQWPPESHERVFPAKAHSTDELDFAKNVLAHFLPRAWHRPVTDAELNRKLLLFKTMRPACDDFEQAMVEVLATVLSSPNFLYLAQSEGEITDYEIATRLSMFLWSSLPDSELLNAVSAGRIREPETRNQLVEKMLADPRSKRFSKHFTRQWLGMQLLDFLDVDKKAYPRFSPELKKSMQGEPIAFFHHLLEENRTVMDFLHADYILTNQALAAHYGVEGVFGNDFEKVSLTPKIRRGGLLTQAGLLAMNSDGKDSHPLKRGIWLLESLLNDPPPPPPPPRYRKLTSPIPKSSSSRSRSGWKITATTLRVCPAIRKSIPGASRLRILTR